MNSPTSPPPQIFSKIRNLVEQESLEVDRRILKELGSDVILINQIGHYIVNSGGKRLRPLLMLLASKALFYEGEHHITLAAALEFIHTATLLHDDVVDESTTRRGHNTVNSLWGNSASVLVGDYLYSRAFEMMVGVQQLRVMQLMASTTTTIAEGEVLQLLNCNNPDTTEDKYLAVISRKTAVLFSAAAQLAAVLVGCDTIVEISMKEYGLHLGIAFQLIDDVLDYHANPNELGKNLGDDLADGKPTLPLIYAIKHANEEYSQILRQAIERGNRDAFREVHSIVESTLAIDYTLSKARQEASKAIEALSILPPSVYKEGLINLAFFSIGRNF